MVSDEGEDFPKDVRASYLETLLYREKEKGELK